jgi:stage II sporulation protein P
MGIHMDMEKRVSEWTKKENGILYEPPDPLFSPIKNWRRIRIVRAVFALVCAAAIVAAVIFLSVRIAALFDGREGGNGGSYPIGDGQSQSEQTEKESTESTEGGLNGGYVTESFTEDNTESEPTSGEETSDESEGELTTDTSLEPLNNTVTIDISDSSGSLGHVINFSDKDIDEDGLLDGGFMYTETRGDPAPMVMIIHTHTSEEYMKADGSSFKGLNSVVSVGESINAKLNAAGLSAVHCTVIHDADDVNAYISARETIKTMLQIYPSIKYVIDVHRMDREEDGRIVKTLSEVGSAQMKITVSADGTTGRNWQDGLALAIALRQELNSDGKALCAPTVLSAGRYNSDLCRYYLMLDVGARGNTTEEAMAAGEYFAEALLSVVLTN